MGQQFSLIANLVVVTLAAKVPMAAAAVVDLVKHKSTMPSSVVKNHLAPTSYLVGANVGVLHLLSIRIHHDRK